MRIVVKLFAIVLGLFVVVACEEGNKLHDMTDREGGNEVVGFVTVDLDASRSVIRAQEALLGNLIADAVLQFSAVDDELAAVGAVQLALINGGSIRFTEESNPGGIYAAGELTAADLARMLPFSSELCVVTLGTLELMSVFERSVAGLPEREAGGFLQLSSGFSITVELERQAQVIDENVEPIVIVTPGQRVLSMRLNGSELMAGEQITLIVSRFIADGGDGYVVFQNLSDDRKACVGKGPKEALTSYLASVSPVTVDLEGRIIFSE